MSEKSADQEWFSQQSFRNLMKKLSTAQWIGCMFAALFYVMAGMLHFVKPEFYLRIMPPYIPWHLFMVQVSGAGEIVGGLGLLFSQTRRAAAWGLIALLMAVFPANLYVATNPIDAGAAAIAPMLRWGRLPLQVLLILWLVWCTKLLHRHPVDTAQQRLVSDK